MKIIEQDIWQAHADGAIVVIPTNGNRTTMGLAVMGKGLALDAAQRFPLLPIELGELLRRYGNQVFKFPKHNLFTFPTKNDWRDDADLNLIRHSAMQLLEYSKKDSAAFPVAIPKLGCGEGKLSWDQVEPIIEEFLGDLVVLTRYEEPYGKVERSAHGVARKA